MKKLIAIVLTVALLSMGLGASAAFALPSTWQLNPDANAEVSVVGDTITLGVAGRAEGDLTQIAAVHGASIELPPAEQIYVEFTYDLSTWDSYNALTVAGTGYWDSFSISVSQNQYWNLALSDPLNGDPLSIGFGPWGGALYGDTLLDSTGALTGSATMTASTASTNYLNVVLDTLTDPQHNGSYPSWGTIEITKVEILGVPEVTKELVGATPLTGNGDAILDLGEKWNFTLEITVTNNTFMPINNVVVKDNFGGDLELVSVNEESVPTPTNKKDAWTGTVNPDVDVMWTGKTLKAHLWWDVGTLEPGDSETLTVVVSTDVNTGTGNGKKGGHQEYTEGGEYCLNSGATSQGSITVDSAVWPVSDTTDEICVEIGQAPPVVNDG